MFSLRFIIHCRAPDLTPLMGWTESAVINAVCRKLDQTSNDGDLTLMRVISIKAVTSRCSCTSRRQPDERICIFWLFFY